MIGYSQHSNLPADYVKKKIAQFLIEDLPGGDVTTKCTIAESATAVAEIQAADKMIFAGSEVIPHSFEENCKVEMKAKDGEKLHPGSVIGIISGNAQSILAGERVMLNLIQRLCGIATLTREYVEISAP